MPKRTLLYTGLAIALATGGWAISSPVTAQMGMMGGYGPGMMYGPGYGPGMMGGYGPWMMPGAGYGHGMMHGYGPGMMHGMMHGYGPGMMYGPGYGPGMMGPGWYGRPGDLNLSTNDVKSYFERWITIQGNPRVKVGDVKEKDANVIEADIVTKEGNVLVQRFTVDRRTGFYRPSES